LRFPAPFYVPAVLIERAAFGALAMALRTSTTVSDAAGPKLSKFRLTKAPCGNCSKYLKAHLQSSKEMRIIDNGKTTQSQL
jgi:cytidine deaminase